MLGKLGQCGEVVKVLCDGRDLLAHRVIDEEFGANRERAKDHDIGEGDSAADEVLLATTKGSLEALEGANEVVDVVVESGLVKGAKLVEGHHGGAEDVGDELAVGKGGPLGDEGGRLEVQGAEELRGPGSRRGDVLGDGGALGETEAVGALKGRDLAEGELCEELGGGVGLAHLKGRVEDDLEAVELAGNLGLGRRDRERELACAATRLKVTGGKEGLLTR